MERRSLLVGIAVGLFVPLLLAFVFSDHVSSPKIESQQSSGQEIIEETDDTPFTNLYRGDGERNFYDVDSDKTLAQVIEKEDELRDMWRQIFSGSLPPPLPDVDFDTQSILLVMSAQLSSRGYLLTINNVTIDEVITIDYELKRPGAGCSPTAKETRPLHIIAVEKTGEKPIELNESTLQAAPCRVPLN